MIGSTGCFGSQTFFQKKRENEMKKTAMIAIAALTSVASAEVLLEVDLSVADTITITATNGLSAVTATGSTFTGVLLADFFTGAGGGGFIDSAGIGNLTSAANASDGSPGIFNSSGNFGLNIWAWTADSDSSFTAGSVAFTGAATWALDSADYADLLAGNTSGDIYFEADTDDDIPSARILGTWNVVPAPSALALLGLGGIAAGRRRR